MKRVLAILFLQTCLFASNVVDIYRDSGIKAVEEHIQKQLQSKSYWDEYLKNIDVSLGYYENLDSLIIANKKSKKLSVYRNTDQSMKFVTSYSDVIVGADGDKQEEGDLKTPLGVYDIRQKFTPPDPFYGPLAFVLSYPNTFDKVKGKNGYGIWIHGSPLDGSERDPMSKGCIVLDNQTIKLFDKNINHKKSVTIVSEDGLEKVTKKDVSIILSNLFLWKESWKKSDVKKYLSYYDDDFRRYDGMKKKNFSRMKKIIFSRKQSKKIIFQNINISPYPNTENKKLFKIAFYEIYKASNYKFNGNKELFVELKDDSIFILSEK